MANTNPNNPQNFILFGVSKYEGYIFENFLKQNPNSQIFNISSDAEVEDCLSKIRYKPIFAKSWVVVAKLDGLSKEYYMSLIKLLINPNVSCYYRLYRNGELYSSLYSSKSIKSIPNLYILNARFPSEQYVKDRLLKEVHKSIEDYVLKYVYSQVRFNIEEFDKIIALINASEFDEIGEQQIKKIIPPSKNKNIRHICYQILLNFRDDLPALWKDKNYEFVSKFSNKKKAPFALIDTIEIVPYRLLNYIIKFMTEMKKVRRLYFDGIFTENTIFDDKDNLKKTYPFLSGLSIPVIREYIFVTREVLSQDIDYCLNEFLKLKTEGTVTIEKIHYTTFRLLNRRTKEGVTG